MNFRHDLRRDIWTTETYIEAGDQHSILPIFQTVSDLYVLMLPGTVGDDKKQSRTNQRVRAMISTSIENWIVTFYITSLHNVHRSSIIQTCRETNIWVLKVKFGESWSLSRVTTWWPGQGPIFCSESKASGWLWAVATKQHWWHSEGSYSEDSNTAICSIWK